MVDQVEPRAREITPASLGALVRRFYARARTDALLGPVFESAIQDWNPHLEQITAFWSTAALGTKTYRGNPLAAHKKHPLTPPMFDRWLALWTETAAELFEPAAASDLAERADRMAESLRSGLFFDPKAEEASRRP